MNNNAQITNTIVSLVMLLAGGWLAAHGFTVKDVTTGVIDCLSVAGAIGTWWAAHRFHGNNPPVASGKLPLAVLACLLVISFAPRVHAQSPILTATNYDAGISVGRNFSSGNNVASAHLIYNLQNNFGIVVFGDIMWNKKVAQVYQGGGGFNLSTGPVQPLAWTGIPIIQGLTVDLFNMSLVANPYHGNGVMAYKNITGAGIPIWNIGNGFVLDGSIEYEVMTSSGQFDGSYWLGTISASHNWGTGKALISFRAGANRIARGLLRKIGAIEY